MGIVRWRGGRQRAPYDPGGNTAIKIEQKSDVTATEPKTCLIAPLILVLMAARAQDRDEDCIGRAHDSDIGGRTLGGASGFGLLGQPRRSHRRLSELLLATMEWLGRFFRTSSPAAARSVSKFRSEPAHNARSGGF